MWVGGVRVDTRENSRKRLAGNWHDSMRVLSVSWDQFGMGL